MSTLFRVIVIDGQGGGIGSTLIKRLRERFGERIEIVALGTNALATSAMMKAGANRGASGENAVCRSCGQGHVIIGPLGIILANSMMGELTPRMADAIFSATVPKLLLPLNICGVELAGVEKTPLPKLAEKIVYRIAGLACLENDLPSSEDAQ